MDCTVRTLFVNFKMLRSLLPIAEDRDSTNHSRAASVVQDRASWITSMKGSFKIVGELLSPADAQDDWEALRD